jgi:hypothetical protein
MDPLILQRLELHMAQEWWTSPDPAVWESERIVVAYTRKHKNFASVNGSDVKIGRKSGSELIAAARRASDGTGFVSVFARLLMKMQSWLERNSMLPSSQHQERKLWVLDTILLATEADSVDNRDFSARSPEGPTAAVLLYEQACTRAFFAGASGPNRRAWGDWQSDTDCTYALAHVRELVSTFRAVMASNSLAPSPASIASATDTVAAGLLRKLAYEGSYDDDGRPLKRSKTTGVAAKSGAAKAKKGADGTAAPPKNIQLRLRKGQRCDSWDDTGRCDKGEECPRFKLPGVGEKAHSCVGCGANDHWLNGPNGRCPSAPVPQK